MKLSLRQGTRFTCAFACHLARVFYLDLKLRALALLLPLLEYILNFLFALLLWFVRVVGSYLPLSAFPHVLLALECLFGLGVLQWFWSFLVYQRLTWLLSLPTSRAERRHPVCNVFIYGLRPRVVLLRTIYFTTELNQI